jgi:hypothetical protein
MASRRKYLTAAELEEYADIAISDQTEADDQISQAEELIDSYVGFQVKSVSSKFVGQATSGTTTTLVDISDDSPLNYNDNYLSYCEVEIVAGTNAGERRSISSSAIATKSITVSPAFTSAIDSTSVYRIRQLGKFPRICDMFTLNNDATGLPFYAKSIPEPVKRAVAAQMQYVVEKGDEFFSGATDDESESIGDYSHNMKKDVNRLIAPKARMLLSGIKNIKGSMTSY